MGYGNRFFIFFIVDSTTYANKQDLRTPLERHPIRKHVLPQDSLLKVENEYLRQNKGTIDKWRTK